MIAAVATPVLRQIALVAEAAPGADAPRAALAEQQDEENMLDYTAVVILKSR